MREIRPPVDVDSLGKLNEWLAECGMPQRNVKLTIEETGAHSYGVRVETHAEAVAFSYGSKFRADDREGANSAHRGIIAYAVRAMYGKFAADYDGQRLVWRVRPEIDEHAITECLDPAGNLVDPITYRGDPADLRERDTGERQVSIYWRYWPEPE